MSLPARLAPPDGQGRVVGVRVAAPANEMQGVLVTLRGRACGLVEVFEGLVSKVMPGNAPRCGGLPEEEKACGPLLRKTPQMKRIPRRVLRARPGLGQPWLCPDAPHPTRSAWCVQWLLPSLYSPPTGPCWLAGLCVAGSLGGLDLKPGRGQPWVSQAWDVMLLAWVV